MTNFNMFLHNSRRFQICGRLVRRVCTSEPIVALTFDDGPTASHTDTVLNILQSKSVKGTFFIVGKEAQNVPQVLERMICQGHEIGNHTYSHARLLFRSWTRIQDEIEKTDEIIRSAGYTGPIFFRPPYCAKLVALPIFLRLTGRTTITWDVEPDSRRRCDKSVSALASETVRSVRNGSIVLLHPMQDSSLTTRLALPLVIDGLRARGFEFVTVSELLRHSRTGDF
jgi:peptidoglycan/xylan/chitin deacetylase (PgdA/CDA1 family)